MPKHPYDAMNIIRDLLDQELIKRREPGFYKIHIIGKNVLLKYYSFTVTDVSEDFSNKLLDSVLESFKKKDSRGYGDIIYFLNRGETF